MGKGMVSVDFYGDKVFLVEWNGEPYVPVKPICENLGLDWAGQFRKLKAEKQRWQVSSIPQQAGKAVQEMLCLPLRKLPAWLMSISPRKVKPELREKLIKYQEECDKVLWDYWFHGRAENPRASQAGDSLPVPLVCYETTGYVYSWYLPLDIVARLLRVSPEDLLRFLPKGTYLESPKAIALFKSRCPDASHHIRSPYIVFEGGLRYLFVRNLMAGESCSGPVGDYVNSLLKKFADLEKAGVPFSVALKVLQCFKTGLSPEEIAVLVRRPRNEVLRIFRMLVKTSIVSSISGPIEAPAFPG